MKKTIEEFVHRGVAAQKAIDAIFAAPSPAPGPKFVAVGPKVLRAGELICGARSATFARRIANALNVYTPNKRGQ